MKPKLILCIALVAFNLSSHARGVRSWSDAELMAASDLVVVGQPISVTDLAETNSLGFSGSKSFQPKFRGVDTTFKVSDVIKGKPGTDPIVLHHYREEIEWGTPGNGPTFVGFTPGDTNEYRLYLKNDGANGYAPAAGQIDPGLSIKLSSKHSIGLPVLPPIAEANPLIRQPLMVQVPTRLKIERTADMLSVTIETNGFESTNLMVGKNMVTGVESRCSIFSGPEASWVVAVNPLKQRLGLSSGLDFNPGKAIWNTLTDGIPAAGKQYVIWLELTAFETDVPPQHEWNPRADKSYRVLWQRTLRQAVD